MDWKNRIQSIGRSARRQALRLYRKAVGEKATPEFIARGWAIGVFFGCLIPFGFQLLLSIPAALWLRGSKTGAVLGTFITNHFTIFVIYPVQCFIGLRCLGDARSYRAIETALAEVFRNRDWQALSSLGAELIAAFFIGGALFALVLTPLTYYGMRLLVIRHRERLARRAARIAARQARA